MRRATANTGSRKGADVNHLQLAVTDEGIQGRAAESRRLSGLADPMTDPFDRQLLPPEMSPAGLMQSWPCQYVKSRWRPR